MEYIQKDKHCSKVILKKLEITNCNFFLILHTHTQWQDCKLTTLTATMRKLRDSQDGIFLIYTLNIVVVLVKYNYGINHMYTLRSIKNTSQSDPRSYEATKAVHFNRILALNLRSTGVMLYRLSYEALLEACQGFKSY